MSTQIWIVSRFDDTRRDPNTVRIYLLGYLHVFVEVLGYIAHILLHLVKNMRLVHDMKLSVRKQV